MSRNVLVGAGGVFLVALLWVVASWDSGAADEEDDVAEELVDEEPVSAASPTPVPAPAPPAPAPATPEPEAPAAPSPEPVQAQAPGQEQDQDVTPMPAPESTGPLAERKQEFQSEPRSSQARDMEKLIEDAFVDPNVDRALLARVICRTTVCKVETRWNPERGTGFMAAFMKLINDFQTDLAMDRAGEADASGVVPIDVYLKRLPPAPPTP